MDIEDLILTEIRAVKQDVKEVHSRVSSMQKDTSDFKIRVEKSLSTIEQIESSCPIREVERTLRDVQATAEEARRDSRRISAIIAAAISSLVAGVGAFFGFGGKG